MLDVWRVKKTGQIVHPIMSAEKNGYTLCLFPFKRKSIDGNYGSIQSVKNENLVKDREAL